MLRDAIQIRPARPADAEVAVVLLSSAYTHRQLSYPLQDDDRTDMRLRLRDYFRQDGNRFSYQYIQVAVHGSEVVGLVLSFAGRDEPRLNAAVGGWLEREAKDDEWYIDALAVLADWGRQGIGTRLVRAAEQQARQHHYAHIALHVAQENQPALSLYTHLGYAITRQAILYQRPHVRMVNTLEAAAEGNE